MRFHSFLDFSKQLFSRRWWWTTLIVLAGIGVTIRLGFWQLDRQSQQQASIDHIMAMQSLPALDLNRRPLPTGLESMEYRQVTVTGHFDFEHQVALRNQVRERMMGTDPGIALLTPLVLSDRLAVLVDRGWVPLVNNTPASWRQYDEPGTVTIPGAIRRSMAQADFGRALLDPTLTPGQDQLDFWNFVNIPRLQQQLPYSILGVYIQQAPGSNPDSLPFRQSSEPELEPIDHVGFAMQWFFFAGLLFFGYPIWLKKQK